MSAQHTPGPWTAKFTSGAGLSVHADVSKALGPRYSHDCPIYHTASDSVGLSIAYELWTQFPLAEWQAMQQANARLIAAAPDLLESAQRLLRSMEAVEPVLKLMTDETLEEGASDIGEDEATREQCAAFLAIRKAIAKATGQKGGA